MDFCHLSQNVLEQLVRNSGEGIWVIDKDGRTIFANPRLAEILARDLNEFEGKSVPDFLSPSEVEKFREGMERRSQGVREDYELKFLKGDGTPIWLAVSATPLFDENGEWSGAVGMIRDLSDTIEISRYLERALELGQSRAFLDSLIENLPNMVFVKDAKDLRFVRFNKAGEELLGFPRTELIGKSDYDFFPAEQADFFVSKDRAVLAGRDIVDISEEQIQTRFKGTRTLHTKKIPVFGKDGAPEYLLGIAEDITEQKKAEQERLRITREQAAAEERERASREFLSIASHELKTPVTSLKIQLQMAARNLSTTGRLPTPEKLKKVLDLCTQQVDRLTRLIEDLLDVSHIQSGKISFRLEQINLSTLLSDIIERYREPLETANCEVRTNLENEVFAFVDRGRIEQVVVNLIANVLKYAPGAPLNITLTKTEDQAQIEVTDNGPGIDPALEKRIFERFGRATSSRNISGLGLGLFISQQIVTAHGGAIRVESQPGSGAKFSITLPLKCTRPAIVDKYTYTAEQMTAGEK